MKNRNWFWGIFFLAAAFFVIASQVNAFIQIGFWTIVATVLLAAVFISSIASLNFFGIFVSLALLYMIYQHPLGLLFIPFWQLIIASILASIGLSMIFHPHHHTHTNKDDSCRGINVNMTETIDGNDIFVKSSFSESCKYLHSESLKTAQINSSFGELTVYFDGVHLSPEGAEINVNVSFAELSLYLPKEWRVEDRVHAGIGAVNYDRSVPALDAPPVTITGSVSFGELAVHYV